MEPTDNILPVLYKQLQGTLTPEEKIVLESWLEASPANQLLLDDLNDDASLQEQLWLKQPENWAVMEEAMMRNIRGRIAVEKPSAAQIIRIRRFWWAAASVLLLLAIGGNYFWPRSIHAPSGEQPVAAVKDIAPGTNGAILTLGNGQQLVLDSLQNGVVAREAAADVRLQEHKLQYNKTGVTDITYNTLTTPRGRVFQVELPDGTHAWLNAASSIRFPTAFIGDKRIVEITGEVYFDVAKNAGKPFSVHINQTTRVDVLGTSFNVNAYANELTVNTTLLNGKVNMIAASGSAILEPGKQAQIKAGNIRVLSADISKVMAWKNGLFNFEGASLEEIMRQLERWYDIEVVYPKGIPKLALTGKITRDVTLQGLLRGLTNLGLHATLEDKKLIVIP